MTEEIIGRTEGAALLMASLERRGAVFSLNEDGYVLADLNGITDFGGLSPETWARLILALKDEIRALICAARTVH